ncbi:T9SS type A sorting domain-containing protein [Hymenobacter latericus]|uniref:T9SS type A sorting domain-containing protein n=1 Tax=Hymenobacter sp. YIM 151858-1 TaxID=2987688 RepID=UPI002226E676|nr:T9SS type A sorting domain-containing protein [Hymenobacter sp. YIM 151858-1]UYZ61332.1 T9SS type A sorting domain-containing protein [Hymenobacter sp. YIM 151858-1]
MRPLAVQVAPNPADAGFDLTDVNAAPDTGPAALGRLDYTLFDLYGVARLSGHTTPGRTWVDTRRVPAGVYQMRVRSATGQTDFVRVQIAH